MLDKKKKYTYEELKEIIEKAHQEAVATDMKETEEKMKENGKNEPIFCIAMAAQNVGFAQRIKKILFGEDK